MKLESLDLYISELPDKDLIATLRELKRAELGDNFTLKEGDVFYIAHDPTDEFEITSLADGKATLKSRKQGDSASRHLPYATFLIREAINAGSLKQK